MPVNGHAVDSSPHALDVLTGFDLAGVVFTFVTGIVLAAVSIVGKRSLTPSIISHALINLLIEPWLLLFIVTMYARLASH